MISEGEEKENWHGRRGKESTKNEIRIIGQRKEVLCAHDVQITLLELFRY